MKLILHIGLEKTGTSTIQEFLLQEKDAFQLEGFYYLHMDGRNEYRELSAYCMSTKKTDNYFRLLGVDSSKDRALFNERFLASFQTNIDLIPDHIHTVIISSEHLSSRLDSLQEIQLLEQFLSTYFSSIKILCYLRNPISFLCSKYSTQIKSGGREKFEKYIENKLEGSEDALYSVKLGLWEQVFGFRSMSIRLFETASFKHGNLILDFLMLLDESFFNYPIKSTMNKNRSLSKLGCIAVRKVNFLFPMALRKFAFLERLRLYIVELITQYIPGKPMTLSAEQSRKVSDKYRVSNEIIREKYFPERRVLFEPKI